MQLTRIKDPQHGKASPLSQSERRRWTCAPEQQSAPGLDGEQLLIAFLKTLCCFADKLLGRQSLCLFRGRHKQISLGVPRPDAIFIVPRVPLIPCGSMCKLILYAAHLNGANCISPLDNILLLPVIPGVSCICVGALERERFSEHPAVQVSFGKMSPHHDSGTSLGNLKGHLNLS